MNKEEMIKDLLKERNKLNVEVFILNKRIYKALEYMHDIEDEQLCDDDHVLDFYWIDVMKDIEEILTDDSNE